MWKVYRAGNLFFMVPMDAPVSHEIMAKNLNLAEAKRLIALLTKGNENP